MNGSRDVPQPIPYQGSKRQIAPTILHHFPASIPRLVEPFAGSAAMSIAVAAAARAERFWINDAHSPLIQLWREIIHRPEGIADRYTHLWNDQIGREREYFNEVRKHFNDQHEPADFLYLLARCVKRRFGTTRPVSSTTHQTIDVREPAHRQCANESA